LFNIILLIKLFLREWLAVHFKKKWYSSPISFIEEIPLNKIQILLDANFELLAEVGDFIKQSTELQKCGPCRSKVWHVKNIIFHLDYNFYIFFLPLLYFYTSLIQSLNCDHSL
jgi:uncharacterized membrane protein (UPF0182 family)